MSKKLLKRSAETRFIFHFSRALNNPRGCTVILTDQFGHKHKQWIRLWQATRSILRSGRRAVSYCRVLPEGVSDALAARAAIGIAISRRERTETPSSAADEYGEGHRKEPWV